MVGSENRFINGENEVEVYLIEHFENIAQTDSDVEGAQRRKTNLQKTHKLADPTGVHVDARSMTFNKLWLELKENHAKVNAYSGMERISNLEGVLEVPCYNASKGMIVWVSPLAIFRKFITSRVVNFEIEGAMNVITTASCEFITKTGKKTIAPVSAADVVTAFGFRNSREPVVSNMVIVKKFESNYSGYMYNLELPKIHNFVCQGLLMNDIEKSLK